MFTDGRSKKVVFVAHCILNQNSISDGTAEYPGAIKEVLELFISSQIGIIQMPCPELMCLGLDRGNVEGSFSPVVEENTRIRASMRNDLINHKIEQLAQNIIHQILEYKKHNFKILGIIGINRSPSCGVNTTSDTNKEIVGRGLFIDSLNKTLKAHQLSVNTIGIKASDLDDALNKVRQLIESY